MKKILLILLFVVSAFGVPAYRYVNPGAAGTNSGTQANPWTSTKTAMNAGVIAAGDTVLLHVDALHDSITAALIDSLKLFGTANAPVLWIGKAHDWVTDSQYYWVASASSPPVKLLEINAGQYQEFRNITWRGGTSGCVISSVNYGFNFTFDNCKFENSGGCGLDLQYARYSNIVNCEFTNNTTSGFLRTAGYSGDYVVNCKFTGNGTTGMNAATSVVFVSNLFYRNTGNCITALNGGAAIYNTFFKSSAGAAITAGTFNTSNISFNRSSNMKKQFLSSSAVWCYNDWNSVYADSAVEYTGVVAGRNSVIESALPFVDTLNNNFAIINTAKLRRTPIVMGGGTAYPAAGALVPTDSACTGGGGGKRSTFLLRPRKLGF